MAAADSLPPRVFINYRRDDTREVAGALHSELAHVLEGGDVFLDQQDIEPPTLFSDALRSEIERASVVLVLIGPQWLTLQSSGGVRRLDEPGDGVRREIELALQAGKPVVPVLVDGARPLTPSNFRTIPSLEILASLQALPLEARDWERHFEGILSRLEELGFRRRVSAEVGQGPSAATGGGSPDVAQRVAEERAGPVPPRRGVIAGYRSDDPDGHDLLGITKDVEALASVLAARDVAPPVSVGLFGDWGTGKTFFMRKLQAAIEARWMASRGANGQSAYCENIVQLQFNAWHYIDTNLWASLTAEIFEGLARAVAVDRRGLTADELRAIAAQSRDVYTDAERRKGAADAALTESEGRLKRLTTDEASVVASLDPGALVREVHRFVVRTTDAGKQLEQAARELNVPPVEATITDVKAGLLEFHGIWGRIKALWMAVRNDRTQWVWGLFLAGLVCALAIPAVTWMLKDQPAVKSLAYAISVVAAAAAGLKPFLGPVKRALGLIEAARTAQRDLIERERTEKKKALEQERDTIRQKVSEAQRQVEEASAKLKSVERQLQEMRADRQMLDFIRRRHESTDYTQHLGIIARARNDFENLADLLARANRESARDGLPRVNRIILYVDDLDRCPEDKVVDVLQAVHLLLAFPLFVVVVGVDSRWLLHSLRLHSKAFQQVGTDEWVSDEERRHWQSTPLNYLEKIFQIPFTLRPMDPAGFGRLIDEVSSTAPRSMRAPATGQAVASPGAASPATSDPATAGQNAGAAAPASPSAAPAAAPAPPSPPIELDPEYLRITDWERAYLKRLYPMMQSPRGVKRLVNVYRLLRASVDDKVFLAFVGDANDGHYRRVLLLLAILTGYPTEATEMLRGLLEEDHAGSWWEFVGTFRERAELPSGAPMSAGASPEAERWHQLLDKLDSLRGLVPEPSPCREFARWARAVARYSFESGRVLLIAGTEEESLPDETTPGVHVPPGPA